MLVQSLLLNFILASTVAHLLSMTLASLASCLLSSIDLRQNYFRLR